MNTIIIIDALLLLFVVSVLFTIARFVYQLIAGIYSLFRPKKTFTTYVSTIDGDSLAFWHNGQKCEIRVFGIDAPEWSQPEGPKAASMMRSMVDGQEITVKPIKTDKYNRLVSEIYLSDGTDIGRTMVQKGMAIAEIRFSKKYLADEKYARFNKIGLWKDGGFITPSKWREAHKAA